VSNETVDFVSMSVVAEEDESIVSPGPSRMEGGHEAARDEVTLCSLDVLREVESLPVIMWTRLRTS
jgi:hypothetical protein